MKLFIDFGNTIIKTAVWKNNKLFLIKSIENNQTGIRKNFISNYKKNNINKVIFTSVINRQTLKIYMSIIKQIFNCPFHEFKSTKKLLGVKNAYTQPNKLGSDRWAAIVGSYLKFKKALCLVDCGTAISIDYVTNSGNHLGGYILSGIDGYTSSFSSAHNLKNIRLKNIHSAQGINFPKSTEKAIFDGYTLMVISAIEKSYNNFCSTESRKPLLIVSGGYGQIVSKRLSIKNQYDPNIVLNSLAHIAR